MLKMTEDVFVVSCKVHLSNYLMNLGQMLFVLRAKIKRRSAFDLKL